MALQHWSDSASASQLVDSLLHLTTERYEFACILKYMVGFPNHRRCD
jgi:hypothetical protein